MGCVSADPSPPTPSARPDATVIDNGYALLYDIMGSEKDVSKLLVIKGNRKELGDLIKDIAKYCKGVHDKLGEFAKADPSLNLKERMLPYAEVLTREHESKTRGKELLIVSGKNLEVQLLLTQNEALTYATQLASVISESDSNTGRAEEMRVISAGLANLEKRVNTMLLEHYSWEPDK